MNYSQLIQGYLDNSLTQGEEAVLFQALSTNDELRNEFKQSIAMDKSMSKRISAFVPSSTSTVNIFSQLGIGAAAGVAASAAAVGLKQTLITFLTTYSQAIISGVIAVALTTAGFLAFHNPKDSESTILSDKANLGYYSDNYGISSLQHDYASIYSVENNNVVIVDTVVKYITRKIVEQGSKTSNPIPIEADNAIVVEEPLHMASLSTPANATTLHQSRSFNFRQIENNNTTSVHEFNKPADFGLSVELKGNGYWSLNKPDVPQYSSSLLTNMQVTALYRLSDHFKLGFDIRQESFYQNFTGSNEIGEEFNYKQYPGYVSIGLVGRYSFLKNNIFSPFVQLGLGGTATGYTGRALLGIELFPMSALNFVIGIEGSNLLYLHQGKIFNSPKLGLNYGISFNF
jgi:hypothetical protein